MTFRSPVSPQVTESQFPIDPRHSKETGGEQGRELQPGDNVAEHAEREPGSQELR